MIISAMRDVTTDRGVFTCFIVNIALCETVDTHLVHVPLSNTAFPVIAFDTPRHGRFYFTRWISVALGVT